MKSLFGVLLLMTLFHMSSFSQIIHLWNGPVPGESSPKKPATPTADSSRGVTRLTDVTDPIMQVFTPDPGKANGAAVVVCPGGGYQILAINLEGYEIAKWLNGLGFTAFVLQYRVPQKQEGALQDVQRAIRIVRHGAKEWKLSPDKIGVLGFSAGGSLSARASTLYNKETYPKTDAADAVSARPDFAVLIYPAYLDQGANRTITPELKIDSQNPPMFLFATADDPYGNSALVMAGALRDAKVPAELHFYAKGGHGYGLRLGNPAADVWPLLAARWLEQAVK
ncbi:alpha/beta hydrolase [Chitinophaga tropicalis]|uniref:Alpha/beta hydrolase fold domain-containing protein n=1 Tax=Chitinophaga tropicalis TaxID=2683588 RepID=A0A7K1U3Q5_9BACT|nr:alpha/beta hydrolase [Chitinophaga tropicalis]MVT08981.1 alpha/beta hydrolase fold domain-containing protein [Chitinophaga tropicalis]